MPDARPFISYAREDRELALRLCNDLRAAGAQPWLDINELLPGQEWQTAIAAAIKEATHIIAVLSSNSVNKTGYVQKELRHAIDLLDATPPKTLSLP